MGGTGMSYFGQDPPLTIEGALEKLKKVTTEKDNSFQTYQKMYPFVKQIVEKYGDQIYSISWDKGLSIYFGPKYRYDAPTGVYAFIENLGLMINDAKPVKGGGTFEISIKAGVRNIDA